MATKLEEIEDKFANDAKALEAEMQRLRHEWAVTGDSAKTVIEAEMTGVKEKAQALEGEVMAEMERSNKAMDAMTAAYGEKVHEVSDAQKADIAESIAEMKADHAKRMEKLGEANSNIKKALGL